MNRIQDGQHFVAAMAATLTVLLARTFYVLPALPRRRLRSAR